MAREHGYLLIEWLIALAISLLLISVLVAMYLSCYQSYHLQQSLFRNQDNAAAAITTLKKEIQLAGYIGCAKLADGFPVQAYGEYTLTSANKLIGSSSEVTVRHAEWPSHVVLQPITDNISMRVSGQSGLNVGNIAIISDCKKAEIFQVAKVYRATGYQVITAAHPLHYEFTEGAEVSRLAVNTYRIRESNRKYPDGSPVNALVLQDIHHQVTEIAEQVDQLQIVYEPNHAVAVSLRVNTQPIARWWYLYAATQ